MNKEELEKIINGKLERYNKFNSGFVVETYDGADIKDLNDGIKDTLDDVVKMGKVDYSMWVDGMLEQEVLDYYKNNGVLHANGIVLVNHNYSQKSADDRNKNNEERANKNIKKKQAEINRYELRKQELINEINKANNDFTTGKNELNKASTDLDELIKKEENKVKSLDKKRRRYISDARDKYDETYNTIIKDLDKQKKKLSKYKKEYNAIIKGIKKATDSVERINKNAENKVEIGTSNTLKRTEVDTHLVNNGFYIERKSYSETLQNEIDNIKEDYKTKLKDTKDAKVKSSIYKDRDEKIKKIIDENKNEIVNTKIHYTYHDHTSSKGRNIKDIYVEEYRTVNGGEKDYTYSISSNKNVVDRLGLKQEAVDRYNIYNGLIENLNVTDSKIEELNNNISKIKIVEDIDKYIEEEAKNLKVNKSDLLDTMDSRNSALFKLVEYDSYDSLTQSAVNEGYTRSIMPENIAIISDVDVEIQCDAMVESLLNPKEQEYRLTKVNKESFKYNKAGNIKIDGNEYTLEEFKKRYSGDVEFKENKSCLSVTTTDTIDYSFDEEVNKFVGSNGDTKTFEELKQLNATPRNGIKVNTTKDDVKLELIPNYTTKNVMWDGMCVVDESAWNGDSKFALLRNEMFKSGATKMKLQDKLKDLFESKCKSEGINEDLYNEAFVIDLYGDKKLLKDIKLLTTENSSKFDKFAKFKYPNAENPKALLKKDWDKVVRENGGLFGIVKTEHASKFDEVQQMSYQMWNSFDFGDNKDEVVKNMVQALNEEIEKINLLKTDDVKFIEYLNNKTYEKVDGKLTDKVKSEFDNDQYIIKMAERNPEILNTKEFRQFKSAEISEIKNKLIKGKAKFMGDNMTLVGDVKALTNKLINPNLNGENIKDFCIFDNEPSDYVKIYSPKFAYNEKVVMMRSPHTGSFSIVVAQNKYDINNPNEIDKYLDLGDNLCVVDNTQKAFQDLTAGSDLDSDFCYSSNDKNLVKMAERTWGKKPIPVNKIGNSTVEYLMNAENQVAKDFKVGASNIGEVANLAQIAQSQYTHMLLNEDKFSKEQIKGMEEILYRLNCAEGIAIDNAKRLSNLDLKEELVNLRARKEWITIKVDKIKDDDVIVNAKEVIWKPNFFNNVQNKSNKQAMKHLDCNMDILNDIVEDKVKVAEKIEGTNILDLIIKAKTNKNENVKVNKIITMLDEYNSRINILRSSGSEAEEIFKMSKIYGDSVRKIINTTTLDQNVFKKLVYKAYTDCSYLKTTILKTLSEKDIDKFANCFKEGDVKLPSSISLAEIYTDNILEEHYTYGKQCFLDLNEKIDNFCEQIDKNINTLFYNNIKDMSDIQKNKYLNNTIYEDEVNALSKKWSVDKELFSKLSRKAAIEKDIELTTNLLKNTEEKLLNNLMKYEVKRGYNKNVDIINDLTKSNIKIKDLDDQVIHDVLNSKFKGMTFVDRINDNLEKFNKSNLDNLEENLLKNDSFSFKKQLEFIWENKKYSDKRIITTELTKFYNTGVKLSNQEIGLNKYTFISVKESHTCSECSSLHGMMFDYEEAEAGVNFPYMHSNCKCTTTPYIGLEELKKII